MRAKARSLSVGAGKLVGLVNCAGIGPAKRIVGRDGPMPLADFIEIGVFSGKKDEEQPLYLKREKMTQERQTFTVVVDQRPTRGGIDPYNKLVDRNSEDNMMEVTKQ